MSRRLLFVLQFGDLRLLGVDHRAVHLFGEDRLDQPVAVFAEAGVGGAQVGQERRLGIVPALQLAGAQLQLARQLGRCAGGHRQAIATEFLPAKAGEHADVDQHGQDQGIAQGGVAHFRFTFR